MRRDGELEANQGKPQRSLIFGGSKQHRPYLDHWWITELEQPSRISCRSARETSPRHAASRSSILQLALNLPAIFPNWFSLFLLWTQCSCSNVLLCSLLSRLLEKQFPLASAEYWIRARDLCSRSFRRVHAVSPFHCGGSAEYLAGDNYFN
jgi:hypothetical protein